VAQRPFDSLAWLSVALLALGCVPDRLGPEGWTLPTTPSAEAPGVDLYVFGGRDRTRSSAALTEALSGRLGEDSSVLWMGAPWGQRDSCDPPSKRARSMSRLDERVDEAGSAFSVGSPYERMCGASGPPSARTPDTHYMVDLGVGGPRVHTPCYVSEGNEPPLEQLSCPHDDPDEDARVRLLIIDETLWFRPDWDDGGDASRRELAKLDAIVDAIPQDPNLPYLLVTHFPIESEGHSGLGGWQAQSTYRHHPESVQRALADGRISGVIAGLEGNLQFVDDLGEAVNRSSRTWLERPVFQVISGAVGDPDRGHRGGPRASRRHGNVALTNDRYTQRAGYVHLHGDERVLNVDIHARVGGKWRTTSATVDLARPPHPIRRPASPLAPCRNCDPVQGATDGEKWEKRSD
jgi:hypothetical protein